MQTQAGFIHSEDLQSKCKGMAYSSSALVCSIDHQYRFGAIRMRFEQTGSTEIWVQMPYEKERDDLVLSALISPEKAASSTSQI